MVTLGLTGKRSIEQSIRTILLTPKGSVPLRPEFGLGIEQMIDQPMNTIQIKKQVVEQLKKYDPRIETTMIGITQEAGHVSVAIGYKIKKTGEERALIIDNF